MTRVDVIFPAEAKEQPVQNDQLDVSFKPGNYSLTINVPTANNPNPDPNNPPPPRFIAGNYSVKLSICNGECGTKHQGGTYDIQSVPFVLTPAPPGPPGPPPPGPPPPPPAPGQKEYE